MDITLIEFYSFYNATTNPPINRSRSFKLKKESDSTVFLDDERYENGRQYQTCYNVNNEQYLNIISLFESLGIEKALRDKLKSPAPVMPPYVGGSAGSVFTVCIDGETISADNFESEALSDLRKQLEALKEQCGAPIVDIRPAEEESNGAYGIFAAAAPGSYTQTLSSPEPETITGEWICAECGASGNTGRFCTNCGMPLTAAQE